MRCKECDYPLWNIRTRICPECGSSFLPSQYQFAPNSVQFRCPHCGQAYYGNDANGHLVPRSFDCATCGNPVDMDDTVIMPAEGVSEEVATVGRLPWLERERLGTIRAWFNMIGHAMTKPGILGRAIPLQSTVAGAFWFATLTQLIITVVASAPVLLLMMFMVLSMKRAAGPGPPPPAAASFGMMFMILFYLVFSFVVLVLWGLVAHAILRLSGPRPAGGLGATYRALCYSSGANVASAIPCMGMYFGWVWWVVSAVITLKHHQRIGGGRAALSVLAFPVLLVLSIAGVYVGLIFFAVSTAAAARTAAASGATVTGPYAAYYPGQQNSGDYRMSQIALRLNLVAAKNPGQRPAHALEIVDHASLTLDSLIAPGSATTLDVSIAGGTTLDQFRYLPPSEARLVLQKAAAALPPDVVAHRVADVVFTYHGVDLSDMSSQLWVAIMWADPDFNNAGAPAEVFVGLPNGQSKKIAGADFAAALAEQNALRAAAGLAPLPDPSTVTTRFPASPASNQPAEPPG